MATRNNQPHDVPHASSYTAVRNHSANVCSSMQVPPQLAAAASHSNSVLLPHTHAPHATENLFSIDRLFYGTHSRTTYNHSRIVNHFAMLSRTTTNHINLPQQKTFTYHSPLRFRNLQIVCTHIVSLLTQLFSYNLSMETPLDQGSSLLGNRIIINKTWMAH